MRRHPPPQGAHRVHAPMLTSRDEAPGVSRPRPHLTELRCRRCVQAGHVARVSHGGQASVAQSSRRKSKPSSSVDNTRPFSPVVSVRGDT